jgi:methionyl-tRNA formyltransferase
VRVAFAGSPSAAVPPLRALAASAHDVGMVVTQPDRAAGRARRVRPTPVAEAAAELGVPLLRPATINSPEAVAALEEAGTEAVCVVAFGQILREDVLGRWTCLNVHFSLLPAYRGAAPVERALMDGVTRTGVTVMRMDAGLDTGPIVSAHPVDVDEEEDAGTLTARLAELGAAPLVAALDDLAAGRMATRPQPEEGVSFAPKITAADRPLDLRQPAEVLARRVRALSPHVGATVTLDGEPVTVWSAFARNEDPPAPVAVDAGALVLACGAGALEVRELQPPGRRRMSAEAFLRGRRRPPREAA